MIATATFATEHAARDMATLCFHFSKKGAAHVNEQSGDVECPFGHCELSAAADCLTFTASARDRSPSERGVEVITNDLKRFAFREHPNLSWGFAAA